MSIIDRTSKSFIASLVLLALIFAQIAIFAHAFQNQGHEYSVLAYEDLSDHGQENEEKRHSQHKCPECLFAKSFQIAVANDSSFGHAALISSHLRRFARNDVVRNVITVSYQPRAPPFFLI